MRYGRLPLVQARYTDNKETANQRRLRAETAAKDGYKAEASGYWEQLKQFLAKDAGAPPTAAAEPEVSAPPSAPVSVAPVVSAAPPPPPQPPAKAAKPATMAPVPAAAVPLPPATAATARPNMLAAIRGRGTGDDSDALSAAAPVTAATARTNMLASIRGRGTGDDSGAVSAAAPVTAATARPNMLAAIRGLGTGDGSDAASAAAPVTAATARTNMLASILSRGTGDVSAAPPGDIEKGNGFKGLKETAQGALARVERALGEAVARLAALTKAGAGDPEAHTHKVTEMQQEVAKLTLDVASAKAAEDAKTKPTSTVETDLAATIANALVARREAMAGDGADDDWEFGKARARRFV
jgi:hypothetical protein